MNWKRNAAWMLLVAAGMAVASSALAQSEVRVVQGSGPGSSNVAVVDDDTSISIQRENGQLTRVEYNGKNIPLDRVKERDGKLKILDENGKVVYEMSVDVSTPGTPRSPALLRVPGDAAERKTLRLRGVEDSHPTMKRLVEVRPDGAATEVAPPKVMIGIQMAQPDRSIAGHFGFKEGEATMISGVYEGLPASKAGLAPYDLIVAVDGKSPAGQDTIRERIGGKDDGDTVTLTVIQRGQRRELTLKLKKYDQETLSGAKLNAIEPVEVAGMQWRGGDAPQPGTLWWDSGNGVPFQAQEWLRLPDDLQEKIKLYVDQTDDANKEKTEETRRKLLDRMKELEIHPRGAASVPVPPEGGGTKMKDLEKRMQRLEELLEKLVEKQEKSSR